jgi:hypothetical protein
MPRNSPARLAPMVYLEVEVNFRWRGAEPVCAFLTVIEQRGQLHRRIAHTEHVHGTGEKLLDDVQARFRELTLEYVLPHTSPF